MSKERVLAHMRTKVGQPLFRNAVEADIRALYETGKVQNVRIFGKPRRRRREGDGRPARRASLVNEIEIDGAQNGFSARSLRKADQVQDPRAG